jgi:hypothetical protein
MKKLIISFTLLVVVSSLYAQPNKRKVNKTNQWFDDSILRVKTPTTAVKTKSANQTTTYRTSKTPKVNQTKLDDLKNPFDTAKKIKQAATTKNYIGETEKN